MPDDNFNHYCEELLARYTRRNHQAVAQRLESLCEFLRQECNHMVQTMLGGSVRRCTFITGISDVDVLPIVNQSLLDNQPPAKVIECMRDTIQRRLNPNSVTAGNLAVMVGYSGGVEIHTRSGPPKIHAWRITMSNNLLSSTHGPERVLNACLQDLV